jgi:TonB family protein
MPRIALLFVSFMCLGGVMARINSAHAADAGRGSAIASFLIPAESLGQALESYARISGREVLYDSALAEGRRSSFVDGEYAPQVALQILLAGTGLWASFKDTDFFVVGLAPAVRSAGDAAIDRSLEQKHYYGILQAGLRTAFCGAQVLPDSGRIAAKLWIGQAGDVLQVKPLDSTGSEQFDRQVETVLRQVKLGAPPPSDFAQPVTIVVLPSGPDVRQGCDDASQLSAGARP